MAYIVVYQAADGASGYEPCDSLQSAILAAERMRNIDDVEAPRIFRTEEVHFDFRPYYRIEVANDVPSAVEPPDVAPPLEPMFGSSPEEELTADEVVGWPDEHADSSVDELIADDASAVDEGPVESATPTADESDAESTDADESGGDELVEEVTDSVISPRRGLFGR